MAAWGFGISSESVVSGVSLRKSTQLPRAKAQAELVIILSHESVYILRLESEDSRAYEFSTLKD